MDEIDTHMLDEMTLSTWYHGLEINTRLGEKVARRARRRAAERGVNARRELEEWLELDDDDVALVAEVRRDAEAPEAAADDDDAMLSPRCCACAVGERPSVATAAAEQPENRIEHLLTQQIILQGWSSHYDDVH